MDDSGRVWNGRNVVLFLGAIMILIAVVIALGPSALMKDSKPAPTENAPAEHHNKAR